MTTRLTAFYYVYIVLEDITSKYFTMSYKVRVNKLGEYYATLYAGNGQVILTSEPYFSKTACLNVVASIQKNSQDESQFQRKTSSLGTFYFYLKAKNGQIMGRSIYYQSEASRENGISSVMRNGTSEEILIE
jgi:uncharacterized protein YegP (UPF0339 family)